MITAGVVNGLTPARKAIPFCPEEEVMGHYLIVSLEFLETVGQKFSSRCCVATSPPPKLASL
jgi:hypothetical protein